MLDLLITIAISVVAFAILLAFIVFIHEYGHFKTARILGVKVDTFSIGFGPAFLKWTDRKGTVWKVASIPLGGFVKFFGDANAASAGADTTSKGPATTQFGSEKDRLAALLTEEEQKVCFHFKPVWARAAIVAAGPLANFLLAIVIFTILMMSIGTRALEPVVGRVAPDSAAMEAGFEPGDRIVSINGRPVATFDDLRMRVQLRSGDALVFGVDRDGVRETVVATPRRVTSTDPVGNEQRVGQIGIEPYMAPNIGAIDPEGPAGAAGLEIGDRIVRIGDREIFTFYDISRALTNRAGETLPIVAERDGSRFTRDVTIGEGRAETDAGTVTYPTLGIAAELPPRVHYGPIEAVVAGTAQVGKVLEATTTYLGRLVSFREDPRQLGGPVKIAQYAGYMAQSGFNPEYDLDFGERLLTSLTGFIELAALISVSIGFMNLLPIPVLDGGHLVYYAYEAVAGKPLSDRIQGVGFRIGLAIVGTFMIFVLVNDVVGLF